MQIDDEAGFHIEEVRQHTVIQLRGKDLDKAHRPVRPSHVEHPPIGERKGAGCDKIFWGKAGGRKQIPREAERLRLIHVEYAVQQPQGAPRRLRIPLSRRGA